MTNFSRKALLDFQDYLSNKGLMNRLTASARKAAVNKVFGILDESEASDISKLDVDAVMNRFVNLEKGNYTPESLGSYRSRLKSAVDDFLRYQRDPINFKPGGQNPVRRPERAKPSTEADAAVRQEQSSRRDIEAPPSAVNIIPIPIRPDLTIKIQGLPFDLTAAEANKIANVIRAMASED